MEEKREKPYFVSEKYQKLFIFTYKSVKQGFVAKLRGIFPIKLFLNNHLLKENKGEVFRARER